MLTIVIPSYNNLEYLKLCYNSVRKSSPNVELIIFDDGSTDGTGDWLDTLNDNHLFYDKFPNRIGHTILYDRGFEIAKTEYVGILHADMVVAENTIPNIIENLSNNKILSVVCIEPPIHPEGKEKLQNDFGMYPNDFKVNEFNTFCVDYGKEVSGKTTSALFAPWFVNREEYFNVLNGHDGVFAPYGWEDSDIFVRMVLGGFDITTMADTFVYHFTQRGHKWKNGELGNFNDDYKQQMFNMQREFIRKWGTDMCRNNEHEPMPITKYNVGLKIKNATKNVIGYLEPYFTNIHCDTDVAVSYIKDELKNTLFDIQDKFRPYDEEPNNDSWVYCDCNELLVDQSRFSFITLIQFVIRDTNQIGQFKYDVFDISINKLNEYQNSLVKV